MKDYFLKKIYRTNVQSQKGFTLIETIVAVAILILTIVGPMSIAANSLSLAIYSRDQVTAFYLAQDAIEYIRNVRDSNRIFNGSGSTTWLTTGGNDLSTFCQTACTVDTVNGQINATQGAFLLYDTSTGFYTYTSGASTQTTRFQRLVKLTSVTVGREAQISVTMTWTTGSIAQKSFTVKENILNW